LQWTAGEEGVQPFTVTVTDSTGLSDSKSFKVTVTDVAPAIAATGAAAGTLGVPYILQLAVTQPGSDPVQSWRVDWGDGETETFAGNPDQVSHVFARVGGFTIAASAITEDGAFAAPAVAVAVKSDKLTVDSFVPTATGFRVLFDHAFDPSTINLYTAADDPFGPPDVTLVGTASGPVAGSLVIDGDDEGFTFIKTGGVMQADSYRATLVSGAAAFHDAKGGLDGNGDGVPGDNFVGTFNFAPADRALSLPDFMRGPGQPANLPANGQGLPVRFTSPGGVTSLVFTVGYDPALLSITGVSPGSGLPAGAQLDFATVAGPDGQTLARITITAATAIAAGTVDLVALIARVPAGAAYGSEEVLDLRAESVNGAAAAVDDGAALHVVGYLGDANGDGTYTTQDVSRILRVATKADSGFSAWRDVDPLIIADIDGNGAVDPLDASRVSQVAAGQSRPEIPALPATTPVVAPNPVAATSVPMRAGVAQSTVAADPQQHPIARRPDPPSHRTDATATALPARPVIDFDRPLADDLLDGGWVNSLDDAHEKASTHDKAWKRDFVANLAHLAGNPNATLRIFPHRSAGG
jgi:hypothetical protein